MGQTKRTLYHVKNVLLVKVCSFSIVGFAFLIIGACTDLNGLASLSIEANSATHRISNTDDVFRQIRLFANGPRSQTNPSTQDKAQSSSSSVTSNAPLGTLSATFTIDELQASKSASTIGNVNIFKMNL
ncbi:hypothetical protein [Glaciecola sp. SC05]|uniref:hypothetical protein n=1 Tax=Glaciecola sp. SC05 TaxID=1987355 RepID=UPI00352917B0